MLLAGCEPDPEPYAIDADTLAFTSLVKSYELLRSIVPCSLQREHVWQAHDTNIPEMVGTVGYRIYQIRRMPPNMPLVQLWFEDDGRFSWITLICVRPIPPRQALRRLGYDPKALIKHPRKENQWYAFLEAVRIEVNSEQAFERRGMCDRLSEFQLFTKVYRILLQNTNTGWRCKGYQTSFAECWRRIY